MSSNEETSHHWKWHPWDEVWVLVRCVWDKWESCILFRSENLNRRSHLEGLSVNGRIMLRWILNSIMCFGMDPFAAGQRPVEGIMPCRIGNNGFIVMELVVLFESCTAEHLDLRRRKASWLKITFSLRTVAKFKAPVEQVNLMATPRINSGTNTW